MSDEVTAIVCGGPPATPSVEVLPEKCPKCGAETIMGFGLAGGGYGPYVDCAADGCDFFAKRQVDE